MKNLAPYSSKKNHSPKKNVQICIDNIHLLSHLNAFVNVYEKESISIAEQLEVKKNKKLLNGMVVGIKDMFCYENHPLTSASKILHNFTSLFTATSVQRLIDNEAIIIGHQNCDEFGMGSSNENSIYGTVKNPNNHNKVAGGSSGGPAASVKANMCHVALGTDTGGSVRQPASFCGVIGLRPTYSRISRYGVIAYASSFDTVGIFSKTIDDCALVLNCVAGNDQYDNTSSRKATIDLSNLNFSKNNKISYLFEALEHKNLEKNIKKNIINILDNLKKANINVDKISFKYLDYTLPTYYILSTAEASSNLSRYDGIRYGYRSKSCADIDSLYEYTRTEGFGDEVKRRILIGTMVTSAGYRDGHYTKAQKIRTLIIKEFENIFKTTDFVILPTTPNTAFKIGQHHKDPISMYLQDLYTTISSIIGYPSISIPIGVDQENMPIGLQIISKPFEEEKLLGFAKYILENFVTYEI